MIKHKLEMVKKYVVDKIICNSCAKEIPEPNEYLSVENMWGYDSSFDGELHNFEMCTDCYELMIATFKLPVDSSQHQQEWPL